MNYQAFTNDALTVLYETIRGSLAADNALIAQGGETRFTRSRNAGMEEARRRSEKEMLRRGMLFEVIDWTNGQAELPFISE